MTDTTYIGSGEKRRRRPEIHSMDQEVSRQIVRRLDEREISNLRVQRETGMEETTLRRIREGRALLSLGAAIVLDRHFGLGLLSWAELSSRRSQGG